MVGDLGFRGLGFRSYGFRGLGINWGLGVRPVALSLRGFEP